MQNHTNNKKKVKPDWLVFGLSGGLLILFLVLSLINSDLVDNGINKLFGYAVDYFGAYWQVLVLANFGVGIYLAISKYGSVKLGMQEKPDYSFYKWVAMILVTLLASGGVFWAAAEPMFHHMAAPTLFGGLGDGLIFESFAQSFLHWGFLAWAILGTLGTIVMMYVHYQKGFPMRPRALLYPLLGKKVFEKSIIGTIADVISIVSTSAGTLGPIGFLGLQIAYGLNDLFDIPNTVTVAIIIILILVVMAAISAATGVDKGILLLSRVNVGMTIFLGLILLLVGPTFFIIDAFVGGSGVYLQNFLSMSLFRGDSAWLGAWTVFFWGWFIGYAPMLIIFISRISKGRTIREMIIAVSIVAPIATNIWFSIVGGTGVHFELKNPGSVSKALDAGGMEAAVMSIMHQLPGGTLFAIGFLIVSIVFVATTADTISYTISVTITGNDQPNRWLRIFWALLFGALAMVILTIGEDSVTSIQNFIIVTAVPVSILLIFPIWDAPKIAKIMAIEQGIVKDDKKDKKEIKK